MSIENLGSFFYSKTCLFVQKVSLAEKFISLVQIHLTDFRCLGTFRLRMRLMNVGA